VRKQVMSISIGRVFIVILGIALLQTTVWGAAIISNMGQGNTGTASISGGTASAEGFTINAGTNYTLDAAMFALLNGDATALPSSGLNIGLFADAGGKPGGSALVTFSLPGSIVSGDASYSATPNSAFQLAASTTYWLILNDPTASNLNWRISSPAATGSGATDAGFTQGTMTSATQVSSFSPAACSSRLKFEIDATPVVASGVPEPSTLLFAATALCGFAIRRCWRRQ
jgi:hypothetical protein